MSVDSEPAANVTVASPSGSGVLQPFQRQHSLFAERPVLGRTRALVTGQWPAVVSTLSLELRSKCARSRASARRERAGKDASTKRRLCCCNRAWHDRPRMFCHASRAMASQIIATCVKNSINIRFPSANNPSAGRAGIRKPPSLSRCKYGYYWYLSESDTLPHFLPRPPVGGAAKKAIP